MNLIPQKKLLLTPDRQGLTRSKSQTKQHSDISQATLEKWKMSFSIGLPLKKAA
jgi:hypothetical protein